MARSAALMRGIISLRWVSEVVRNCAHEASTQPFINPAALNALLITASISRRGGIGSCCQIGSSGGEWLFSRGNQFLPTALALT